MSTQTEQDAITEQDVMDTMNHVMLIEQDVRARSAIRKNRVEATVSWGMVTVVLFAQVGLSVLSIAGIVWGVKTILTLFGFI